VTVRDLVELDWPSVGERAAEFARTGACVIPGFVRPDALAPLVEDARQLAPLAHRSAGLGTVSLDLPDPAAPPGHPRAWLGRYSLGAVAYDLFPAGSPIRRLYESDELAAYVAAILGHRALHRYADPLGALNLAVMTDGDELQWHFDQTDFVVSLALQNADGGGDLEVVPHVRTGDDERYDDVAEVLAGARGRVVTLPMRPGTLLVFAGRHSLHRVSPVRGATARLVALLGYDTRPGTVSSDLLKAVRYGRVA
jgi:hypothetical protein